MELYFIMIPFLASVIYPVVVAWTWGQGWLFQMGYVDFAGSSVVHLAGAVCTFTASIVLGPRAGRFEDDENEAQELNSARSKADVPPNTNLQSSETTKK